MRFVDRASVDEPKSLSDPSAAVAAEIRAAQLYYQTYDPLDKDAKAFGFKEYKSYDVQLQLRTLFHNKCAYCESDLGSSLEVEHFRPKGGVTEDRTHFGYWWLAHTWTNLLPSCIPCNQKRYQHLVTEEMTVNELTKLSASKAKVAYGKANHFPIAGIRARCSADILSDERAELINPTFDDPAAYLKWSTSGHYSVVIPRPSDVDGTVRALSTISVFALNRAHLVESRTRVLNMLRFQAQKMFESLERDMAAGGSENYVNRALERVEIMRQFHDSNQPYSAMVKEFVDGVVEQLQRRVER
ncbi:hypothetical protein ACNSZF_17535 [Burkholderia gladioli]